MSPPVPTVSVTLVTYNHERYIAEAIRSVLGQTFSDLELIVVDDGSTDRTPEVIASFTDPRLVSIRQDNQGPGAAANRSMAACRGKYVAVMSGDDLCHPERLRKQLEAYVGGGPRVLFSDVTCIGEDGGPAPAGHFYEGLFDVTPRSNAEIYRRFFFQGNFINGITAFTERGLLGDAPYDAMLYQLQDFDLWIRLLKRCGISFLPEPLVYYRIRAGHQNLSSPRPGHQVRFNNEYLFLMRRFFDDVSPELFRTAFASELRRPDCATAEEMACEQAFLYLRAPHPMQWIAGLDVLYQLLSDPRQASVLRQRYGFTHREFVTLLAECDVLRLYSRLTSTLYVDTGKGFNQSEIREQPIPWSAPTFALTFDLRSFPAVRALRWDPVELRHCRVELQRITWQDRAGRTHALNPDAASSNGSKDAAGAHSFETHDAMFFLPVEGDIAALTVEGSWHIQDTFASFTRAGQLYEQARQHIAVLEKQIEQMRNTRTWRWLAPVRFVSREVKGRLRKIRRAG